VLAVTLASVPDLYADYGRVFDGFEAFSVAVFTVEYGLRLWAAPEDPRFARLAPAAARLRYAVNPLMVIDLLAFAPAYIDLLEQILHDAVGIGPSPEADELRRVEIKRPESLLTVDPGLATAPPEQLVLAEEADRKLERRAAEAADDPDAHTPGDDFDGQDKTLLPGGNPHKGE
jgi:hypothetical protein